ncbi:S-type pyocin domain-containing protein [Pseudomonas tolaasii]|uniref:S-type pyocin domain-containing protein n=1 Tax=Pseudomonas tolaasii TaxID=29442 RepID=UPI0015A1D7EB|nr:S-type pyocin domain-containing protein [Pseudomonas tolaasii]NVZ42971.1 S-type pyocin domain-containing protein [Pseudomonas tolaasii]NWA50928.1 S-type pyocin domain-containing protein [Pseudomonas tolaasii]
MSERFYPPTEEEKLRRRILSRQPPRAPYSPPINPFTPTLAPKPVPAKLPGCTFTKPCQLPDGIIHYTNPTGYVPLELIKEYGHFSLLGGREMDSEGAIVLRKISGSALPVGLGQLALRTALVESAATAAGTVAGGLLTGLVALVWPSELGDSALYSEEQLRSMQRARSQMRLHVEQREDGTLKGYGFYTGNHTDWQMIDVVQFQRRGDLFVADLGEGAELIWTPAVDPGDTLGTPALEAAPQAPVMWIYPPTEKAAQILVNPIYPPEYRDFILVFPVESGVRPLYVVVSIRPGDHKYHPSPTFLTAFPEAVRAPSKSGVKGGGKLRPRWKEPNGYIYEWDFERGKVEKYNKRGKHLGEFDPITGERTKDAEDTRRVEP